MLRFKNVRRLKSGYYIYKLLLFFILIAGSYLAINAIVWGRDLSMTSECDASGVWGVVVSIVKRGSECVDASSGTIQRNSVEGKTIWNPLSKSWLTEEQVDLLKLAYDVGYRDGGTQHAQLLQSTLMQESIAGTLGRVGHRSQPVGKRSYGVMQVKVAAARDVIQEHPDLGEFHTDEELIVSLMTDDEFNIRVASKFLLHLRDKTSSDTQALIAYNLGLRASRSVEDQGDFQYVKSVARYFEFVVKPFNRKYLGGSEDNLLPV